MAGRQAASTITRYAGLQVQTSSMGLQIPVGWGTFRSKCNLLDYLDFKSTPVKASTGKGGAQQPTNYNYSASLVLGICEGVIDSVTQVWANSKNYANGSVGSNVANTGSTSACAQAGLSLATGAIGQAVWACLTTNHPDHAIGYSGIAYAYASNYALDSSASPPNHSFEVVRQTGFTVGGGYAGPDIDPSKMISDFFTNTKTGVPGWPANAIDAVTLTTAADSYQKYCVASGLLLSPIIDAARAAADFLTEVMLATNSTMCWSEGQIKFVPYGDATLTANGQTFTPNLTPAYILNDDAFTVANNGDVPFSGDLQDQSQAFNSVQLEYLDRTNQYNMAIMPATDPANSDQFGPRRQDPTSVHVIGTAAVAAVSAHLYLQRTLYVRGGYKTKLPWNYALLEPGDIIEATDSGLGFAANPLRITQIDETEATAAAAGSLDLTCEDLLVGIANAPLYTMQNPMASQPNTGIDPGGVEANLTLWSDDLTNAYWTKTSLTIGAAAHANPFDGTTTAQSLTPPAVSSTHRVRSGDIAVFAGANYTVDCYVLAAGYTFAEVRISQGGGTGSNQVAVNFDLTNAVAGITSISGTGVLVGSSIAAVGGGFYRCSITFQTGDTSIGISCRMTPTAISGGTSFTGSAAIAGYFAGFNIAQGVSSRPHTLTTTAQSTPVIFMPPMSMTPGQPPQTWAAVAGGANWGGAYVWVSYDTTNYALVGVTAQGSARYGYLTATLASHADPDTTNKLSVDLSASNGALTSASQATADAGGTRCLVDSEIIGFETATLTNPNRYTLEAPASAAYLRRGMMNTAPASHSTGATFVRLDEALFHFPYDAQQAGKTASVKFQSFNIYGQGTTPLSQCVAYTCIPVPNGGTGPGSSAWTAVGGVISNGGVSQPALIITGASDNLSASAVEFLYRVHGTNKWSYGGIRGIGSQKVEITSVASGQFYDVAVAYMVSGVWTPIVVIATNIQAGTQQTGGSGGGINTILFAAYSGSSTFTLPASFTGTKIDVYLVGFPGAGNGASSGGGKSGTITDVGGGGAAVSLLTAFPAAAGFVVTYSIAGAVATDTTASGTGFSLTAKPGTNATTGASGTGAAVAGTNTHAGGGTLNTYAGKNGGAVDTWDGGGPGATIDVPSGTVTTTGLDNTSDGQPGAIPGQGGSGSFVSGVQAGGGAAIIIIGRA